jgi:hypothetical protein
MIVPRKEKGAGYLRASTWRVENDQMRPSRQEVLREADKCWKVEEIKPEGTLGGPWFA